MKFYGIYGKAGNKYPLCFFYAEVRWIFVKATGDLLDLVKKRLRFQRDQSVILKMQPPVNYYLFLILAHVVCYTAFNSVYRIQEVADRSIMIQGINDQCDVFAHIAADIVWLLKKLR